VIRAGNKTTGEEGGQNDERDLFLRQVGSSSPRKKPGKEGSGMKSNRSMIRARDPMERTDRVRANRGSEERGT
jgi:hypothetical protein